MTHSNTEDHGFAAIDEERLPTSVREALADARNAADDLARTTATLAVIGGLSRKPWLSPAVTRRILQAPDPWVMAGVDPDAVAELVAACQDGGSQPQVDDAVETLDRITDGLKDEATGLDDSWDTQAKTQREAIISTLRTASPEALAFDRVLSTRNGQVAMAADLAGRLQDAYEPLALQIAGATGRQLDGAVAAGIDIGPTAAGDRKLGALWRNAWATSLDARAAAAAITGTFDVRAALANSGLAIPPGETITLPTELTPVPSLASLQLTADDIDVGTRGQEAFRWWQTARADITALQREAERAVSALTTGLDVHDQAVEPEAVTAVSNVAAGLVDGIRADTNPLAKAIASTMAVPAMQVWLQERNPELATGGAAFARLDDYVAPETARHINSAVAGASLAIKGGRTLITEFADPMTRAMATGAVAAQLGDAERRSLEERAKRRATADGHVAMLRQLAPVANEAAPIIRQTAADLARLARTLPEAPLPANSRLPGDNLAATLTGPDATVVLLSHQIVAATGHRHVDQQHVILEHTVATDERMATLNAGLHAADLKRQSEGRPLITSQLARQLDSREHREMIDPTAAETSGLVDGLAPALYAQGFHIDAAAKSVLREVAANGSSSPMIVRLAYAARDSLTEADVLQQAVATVAHMMRKHGLDRAHEERLRGWTGSAVGATQVPRFLQGGRRRQTDPAIEFAGVLEGVHHVGMRLAVARGATQAVDTAFTDALKGNPDLATEILPALALRGVPQLAGMRRLELVMKSQGYVRNTIGGWDPPADGRPVALPPPGPRHTPSGARNPRRHGSAATPTQLAPPRVPTFSENPAHPGTSPSGVARPSGHRAPRRRPATAGLSSTRRLRIDSGRSQPTSGSTSAPSINSVNGKPSTSAASAAGAAAPTSVRGTPANASPVDQSGRPGSRRTEGRANSARPTRGLATGRPEGQSPLVRPAPGRSASSSRAIGGRPAPGPGASGPSGATRG